MTPEGGFATRAAVTPPNVMLRRLCVGRREAYSIPRTSSWQGNAMREPTASDVAADRRLPEQNAHAFFTMRTAKVFEEAGEPLDCKTIVERAFQAGYWQSDGTTPAATVYSAILREIQKKGDEARFRKAARGRFEFAGYHHPSPKAPAACPPHERRARVGASSSGAPAKQKARRAESGCHRAIGLDHLMPEAISVRLDSSTLCRRAAYGQAAGQCSRTWADR